MRTGYFWPVHGDKNEIAFPFSPTRASAVVREVLGEYCGVLLSDGYGAYEKHAAGVNGLVLRAEPHRASIHGRVRGAEGAVRVALFNPSWRNPMPAEEVTADVEGRYRFETVQAGNWERYGTNAELTAWMPPPNAYCGAERFSDTTFTDSTTRDSATGSTRRGGATTPSPSSTA